MKRKYFIKVIISVLILIIFVTVLNYPIFEIYNKGDIDTQLQNIIKSSEKNMCVLDYSYTTGAGWRVLDSTDKAIIGEYVVLKSLYDPRLLKDNKEFDLDYLAQYIVTYSEISKIEIDNEKVTSIQAEEIIVVYNTDKTHYKITDLSLSGMFKSFLSLFNPKYKFSK